jgi:3-hydroxyacyl-CoA dehydrogenase/enoyl-CoA hydratase/3-hydroxybutyryl-CoA epimerase
MTNIKITYDADQIATIWFDVLGKSVNTLGPTTLAELSEAIDEIELKNPIGVIFASAKPRHFIAGADLFAMRDMAQVEVDAFIRQAQTLFSRIEKLSMPTVAAISGDCLGGGLEMSLACKYRLATGDASFKIGLPETKLGILPGSGGTVRMTRTLGVLGALPLMIAGKTLAPKKAAKAGVIDEVVRPETLMDAARRLIKSDAPRRRANFLNRLAGKTPLIRRMILNSARKRTELQTHGHYPAPLKLIDVVEEGLAKGEAAGFDAERKAILQLNKTVTCRKLMRLFFLRQGAKKQALQQIHGDPHPVHRVAVVGGGTMGAGIVHAFIASGIPVRLIEVNDEAVSAGLRRIKGMLDDDVRAGCMDKLTARHTLNRVAPTTEWDGLKLCDFAIEAVVEKLEVKRQIFARLERLLPGHAVLASNTSSLNIAEIAAAISRPQRVVGMHFFNPVPKMPLVEIVRSPLSGDDALATAIALTSQLGKTPVLVRDGPGFLVNRLLIPYLAEAAIVAREGADFVKIDMAMKRFGWPMGPYELLDEIGLDVAAEVVKSLVSPDVATWLEPLIKRGWLGKKTGRGFYIYGGKTIKRNSEVKTRDGKDMDDTQIEKRLMKPMIAEAKRVLDDGIVSTREEIDLATVLGLGFPPFLGGLASYAGMFPPLAGEDEEQKENEGSQYAHV